MEAVVDRGIQVLISPDAGKRKGARPGWDGGHYAFMRRVLETDQGAELYRKRKAMIEPVFADTKFNRRIDRFLRRGRIRGPLGMAADHRHQQPPQAPPADDRHRVRRTEPDRPLKVAFRNSQPPRGKFASAGLRNSCVASSCLLALRVW